MRFPLPAQTLIDFIRPMCASADAPRSRFDDVREYIESTEEMVKRLGEVLDCGTDSSAGRGKQLNACQNIIDAWKVGKPIPDRDARINAQTVKNVSEVLDKVASGELTVDPGFRVTSLAALKKAYRHANDRYQSHEGIHSAELFRLVREIVKVLGVET